MAHILVTGGAGYIGAVVAARLRQTGHSVTVLDNFSTGHRAALLGGRLVEADLGDSGALGALFSAQRIDGVMHFASLCLVGESVTAPSRYFHENVGKGLTLFDAMIKHGVSALVLSSSCAVYGMLEPKPVSEDHPRNPVNPYGETKLFLERILKTYGDAYGIRSIALRYFNACGASLDGMLGESHHPETHLVPRVLRATSSDADSALTVFGDDYETPDGTCIRDYIHVEDLATAHIAAMERLLQGGGSGYYNLGSGEGLSVRRIIESAERVTALKVRYTIGPRRAGDPPVLVANPARARSELAWSARYSDPETILTTAWKWFQSPRY